MSETDVPVDPQAFEGKLNKLVERTIVDKNFSNSLLNPETRDEALEELSFGESERELFWRTFEPEDISDLVKGPYEVNKFIKKALGKAGGKSSQER